jgi:pimeloyl-[acyl-carrier protein] methyl ester esterase
MSMYVESSGKGPDLFLIHGWGMHGGIWHGLTDALARNFRVHAVDLPGMGYSPPSTLDTLPRLAARLADLLPPQSAVCGWSLGGQVAMRLALAHPEKVSRLVLVASTPRFVSGSDWQFGVDGAVFGGFADQVMQDYQATMGRFLALQAFGGESSRELIRELRERFSMRPEPNRHSLQQALQMLLLTDLREEIAQLRQPILLLHGDRDTLAPVGAAHWMAGRIPPARLRVIHGASHAPFLSHPAAFLHEMTDFLE